MNILNKLLTIVFLLFAFNTFAQQKGDNKIILTTTKSADENYIDFGRHLLANGFEIRVKDDSFLSIGTKWKEYKFGKNNVSSRILALDMIFNKSNIEITPKITIKGTRGKFAKYDPKKADIVRGFEVIEELLKGYGGDITYSKQ